jgi:tetratricopeptide (TPR) repeat protein
MKIRSWSLLGASLVHAATAAVAQTPPPRTWLAPLGAEAGPGAGMISEKFDEATRVELRKSKRIELRGDSKPAQSASASGADPRVEQAENLRTAGKASFAKKDYETALKQLQGALAFYEEGLAYVNRLEAVLETLGYLGACSLALGYDDDAKDYFQRVLAIMPEAAPLDDYPVQSIELFEKLKTQQGKKKKGSLTVKTDPPGGVVKVDGTERGPAPVTITDLARGEHYVQASQDAAGVAGLKVEVKGGKAETVELKLSTQVGPEPAQPVDPALVREVARLAAEGKLGAPFRERSDQIAELTKAGCLVVGHVEGQGNGYVLAAYVYSPEQKQTAALDEVRFRADLSSVNVQATAFAHAVEEACNRFPYDKIVVGGVVAARTEPAPPPPPPPSAPPSAEQPKPRKPLPPAVTLENPEPLEEDEDDDTPWYKEWWVWTVAGAALIGGAVAAGFAFAPEDTDSTKVDAEVKW